MKATEQVSQDRVMALGCPWVEFLWSEVSRQLRTLGTFIIYRVNYKKHPSIIKGWPPFEKTGDNSEYLGILSNLQVL
jgi:hypothetical protein